MSKRRSKKTVFTKQWRKELERREKVANAPKVEAAKRARKKADNKTKFVKGVAVRLRSSVPKSEAWFLEHLKNAGLSPYFHSNVQLNNYIPDFLNLEKRIVIEVDGSIHWNNPAQLERDNKKDLYYQSLGYNVYKINHKDEERAKDLISLLSTIIL